MLQSLRMTARTAALLALTGTLLHAGQFSNAIKEVENLYANAGIVPGAGGYVVVQLPPGSMRGIAIQDGSDGWTPLDVVEPWWGDATLVVLGHPNGTTILPAHDETAWGASIEIRPTPKWAGRVWFQGLEVLATGGHNVATGYWGHPEKLEPLRDVRFIDCTFLDNPDPAIRCVRPVSMYQTSAWFLNCTWDMPNSIEHAVYNRNPFGDCGMIRCTVKAVGGQVWQETNRPLEGPYYKNGRTVLLENWFENYHQDDANAGSAITAAGCGRDMLFLRNVVLDIERPDGEQSHGGMVAWDGGTYYTLAGKPVYSGDPDEFGEHSIDTLVVVENIFVQKDPDRSIFKVDATQSAVIQGNGFYGSRPCEILTSVSGGGAVKDSGVGTVLWSGNNNADVKARAKALGIDKKLLIEPDLLVKKEYVGKVTTTYSH